jgi:hypothetical protein
MPPATKHVVATVDNTTVIGGHFYQYGHICNLLIAFAQSFFQGIWITNADHPYLLTIILLFASSIYVKEEEKEVQKRLYASADDDECNDMSIDGMHSSTAIRDSILIPDIEEINYTEDYTLNLFGTIASIVFERTLSKEYYGTINSDKEDSYHAAYKADKASARWLWYKLMLAGRVQVRTVCDFS